MDDKAPLDVRSLVSDEALLNEALEVAKAGRFEFMEQQAKLLAKPEQYAVRVADS